MFFVAFHSGYLKKNPVYSWHYFTTRLLRPGDNVIDIGANMGYYSTLFSKAVCKTGKVYCAEPVAPLYHQLEKQLKRRDNVVLIPYALGAHDADEAIIGVPGHLRRRGYLRHGYLSLQENGADVDGRYSFPAKLRKGSNVFSQLDRIDYIKCDIEGQESAVFKDMTGLLARHHPIVQVEINPNHFSQITALFSSLGYKGYKLVYGKLIDINSLPLKEKLSFDTLFVPAKYFYRITPFLDQPPAPHKKLIPGSSKAVKQPDLQSNPYFSS